MIIKLNVVESTNTIIFHQSGLNINNSSIKVNTTSNSQLNVVSTSYDEDTDFYTVKLAQTLQKGENYSISIVFTGKNKANNYGFYKSFYTDSNGRKRYYYMCSKKTHKNYLIY